MKHFIIRYGVFCLLALMLLGIGWMATHYTLRVKLPVTLCCTKQGTYAWLPLTHSDSFAPGDSLYVQQTSAGNLSFLIDTIRQEKDYRACLLTPSTSPSAHQRPGENTLLTGYVAAGSESLGTLILRKLQFR